MGQSEPRRGAARGPGVSAGAQRPRQGVQGGASESGERSTRGGSRLAPKAPRLPEPAIDADISGKDLDRSARAELRTLSPENAEGVAGHLIMIGRLLDDNPAAALAHAETAVRRAGRVAVVREARGLVAYHLGDWATALSEFRTARRLSGSAHLLPLMVDCERALGRIERALELAASPESLTLGTEERIELAIVVSGIRREAGHLEAAAAGLELPELASSTRAPWTARLRYAYAEAKLALGDREAARAWFSRAADIDETLHTDAVERVEELDGITYADLADDEAESVATAVPVTDSGDELDVPARPGPMR